MNLSYWEYKTFLSDIDFTIVGSGITGLSCALHLRKRYPNSRIVIVEKGILPKGASTKNAGFACFGSISEILSDLDRHSEQEVIELVQKRLQGIQLLRATLGDSAIDFQNLSGHELFLKKNVDLYHRCLEKMDGINQMLRPVFGDSPFRKHSNTFKFKNVEQYYITNSFESQIDTGKMMFELLQLVERNNILILNSVTVDEFEENNTYVAIKTNAFDFRTKKLCIATNGFASKWIQEDLKPARAQVLVTKPIPNLHIKGTFHFDEGYYYFRNIDNRILLGGGRNLDFIGEETDTFGETEVVQNQLEKLLKDVILPETPFEIDSRWSGIMGIGQQKRPIVKQISDNAFCGVRLGGMGIAIGSLIGKELADLV